MKCRINLTYSLVLYRSKSLLFPKKNNLSSYAHRYISTDLCTYPTFNHFSQSCGPEYLVPEPNRYRTGTSKSKYRHRITDYTRFGPTAEDSFIDSSNEFHMYGSVCIYYDCKYQRVTVQVQERFYSEKFKKKLNLVTIDK